MTPTNETMIVISFLVAILTFGLFSFWLFVAVLDEFRKLIKQSALDIVEIQDKIVEVDIKERRG